MRGKSFPKRKINPDSKYNSAAIAKLINYIMLRGQKATAQSIVYGCFDIIKEKSKKDPLDILDQALKNVGPILEVRSRRVGGANYQIPYQVRSDRRQALAFRWIIEATRNKKGKPMKEKLAHELLEAAAGTGEAVKKKENVQKMAEANRAFAHFARIG